MDSTTLIYKARLDAYLRCAEAYGRLEAYWMNMPDDPHAPETLKAAIAGLDLIRAWALALRSAQFVFPEAIIDEMPQIDVVEARGDDAPSHASALMMTILMSKDTAQQALDQMRSFLHLT